MFRALFKFPPDDHAPATRVDDQSHSSEPLSPPPLGSEPEIAIAELCDDPEPPVPKSFPAELISVSSVHEVPS